MKLERVGMTLLSILVLAAGAVQAQAPEESRWSVSLENRLETGYSSTEGSHLGLGSFVPKASYHVGDRWRIDGAFGFTTSDGLHSFTLFPGVRRYYFESGDRRWRLSGGLDLEIEIVDSVRDRVFELPDGTTLRNTSPDPLLGARIVPIEMEYWLHRRGAFTLGFDVGGQLFEGGDVEYGGAGFLAGFRLRLD